jgi:hypothetical protein
LFNHINENEQIARTAKVVEENENLKTELQQRAESAASSTNSTDVSVPGAGPLAEQHQELSEKYDELTKKYQDLSQKVKYLERKNSAVMQKNRDMKDSVRAWQQYADRQKPQQKKGAARAEEGEWRVSPIPRSDDIAPVMPSSPRSVNTVRTPIQHADCGRSSPTPQMLHEVHADRTAGTGEEEEEPEHLPSDSVTPRGPAATRFDGRYDATDDDPSVAAQNESHIKTNAAPRSSQTTVDEVVDHLHGRTQPVDGVDDDDLPQIVSERSLKRKRVQQSRIDVYTGRFSDGTPAKPLRVKDEPPSSPPAALTRTETIDLDDAAAHLHKPSSIHSRTTDTFRHQRSGSAPFSQIVREHAAQQDDIVPDGRPVWSMRASDKRPNALRRSLLSTERQSPLREKPIRELRVHDFKPNPVYNHGYTYAFSETVRKRGDRMCLPGCTNAECCGSHFRRLAEALHELPASQEEAMLEEYLGDAYDTVVSTQMAPDERAELVLQARTKKIAKESGKHREAYERRKTPPGYWRVDFPSTQEQQRDRERAKEQEIKTVQERWLEAQKTGGRWVFRDE